MTLAAPRHKICVHQAHNLDTCQHPNHYLAGLMSYKLFHSAAIIRHIKKDFGDWDCILMSSNVSKFKR